MSVGLNRASNFYYSNPNQFLRIVSAEKVLRKVDDIYLIDSAGNILLSETGVTSSDLSFPSEETFDEALIGVPVIIPGNFENKTSAMIKLNSFVDTFLYISRDIDPNILNYLNETEKARRAVRTMIFFVESLLAPLSIFNAIKNIAARQIASIKPNTEIIILDSGLNA